MTPEKARIILGDDDADVLGAVKFNLEVHGHKVVLAFGQVSEGLAEFERVGRRGIDVAVLDRSLITYAGARGQELIDRCKLAEIPIIGFSSIGRPSWADYFVSKREHPGKLHEEIEKL